MKFVSKITDGLDAVPTDGSTNGVTSNGVFDALALTVQKLSTTVVSTDSAVKQTLYTVPTGKKCYVLDIVGRNPSASLAGYDDVFSFGFDNFASDVAVFGAEFGSLAASQYMKADISARATAGSAGSVLGAYSNWNEITATLAIDVLGYLINT